MWDRQQDLQAATMAGRPEEVGRISQLIVRGAQEWHGVQNKLRSGPLLACCLLRWVSWSVDWMVVRISRRCPIYAARQGVCERRDALYGHRGVRVGEASHPGPPLLRRLRSGRSRGVRADISSEEPLVRHIQRHVVPRIAGVASVAEENDISDVEDHSAVSPTLLDSLAEDLSEARPYTNLRDVGRIGVQIPLSVDRGADECSWASSGSCWGEREDIGEEEGRMGCIVSSTVRPSRGWQRIGGAEESRVGPSRVTGPQSVQDRESPSTMPAIDTRGRCGHDHGRRRYQR